MQRSTIDHIETVILGAGLAGLSAAYHGGGVVFEKEGEIGGTCRSLRQGGYVFDQGIHVLHTSNNYVLDLLSRDKGLGLRRKRRSAWIYSYRTITKYPFQVNTFGLPGKVRNECLTGFMGAQDKSEGDYDNYRDWVYATFGRGIAENFYLPYSEKFWTVKAKELTTDWLGVRVPRPQLKDVLRGAFSIQKKEFGPNALFRYPRHKGIQAVAEAMIREESRVSLCSEAVKIELDKKKVHFRGGRAVSYDRLISTLPLPELLKIIGKVPDPVKQSFRGLRHNSVLCVNLGIKRENLTPMHWLYFPEDKFAAFRVSFPANFSRSTVPDKWSSVQAEISYSGSRPIKHRDIVAKVIKDLAKAGVIKPRDRVKFINTHDIKYAYVIYDHSRRKNLRSIGSFLKKSGIYNAGRYGRWEYQWMDDAILDGRRASREAGRR
ncbi:protoporphyrinogen/coproporphyrinogen oxidase [Candidatus Omnitrophota bacterium]